MKILGKEGITVTYIQNIGSDIIVIDAADRSFSKGKTTFDSDCKEFIKSLVKDNHMTPFEHTSITFEIECPLFIRSQIQRHRTFSFSEQSGRNSVVGDVYYVPTVYHNYNVTGDSKMSTSELPKSVCKEMHNMVEYSIIKADEIYVKMLEAGIAREEARSVLPTSMFTNFWMTGNLRNWFQFLAVRMELTAQYESRLIANKIIKQLISQYPVSSGALMDKLFSKSVLTELRNRKLGDNL